MRRVLDFRPPEEDRVDVEVIHHNIDWSPEQEPEYNFFGEFGVVDDEWDTIEVPTFDFF